jgi:alkanesulfonate monooxygenase SsuD/methylene tetrahydromethanopterin reductase-like flavin-dependent oxidoreductase (luciferase family)
VTEDPDRAAAALAALAAAGADAVVLVPPADPERADRQLTAFAERVLSGLAT